jgi:hypothetical protein
MEEILLKVFLARGFDVWVGNNRGSKYCQGMAGGWGNSDGDGKIILGLARAGFSGGNLGGNLG